MFGSRDVSNNHRSLFHDACLEMKIIRHMKGMEYVEYGQICNAATWLKKFSEAFDQITAIIGGRVWLSFNSRHEEFEADGILFG